MPFSLPRISLTCLVLLFLIASTATDSFAQRVPESREQIQLTFAPLVKKTRPAVVNIYAKRMQQRDGFVPFSRDPFFRRFFEGPNGLGKRQQPRNSLGSGVIISSEGLIITNHHVIKNGTEIRVVLSDNREYEAEVIFTEERTDLAVLKVDAEGRPLPFLELGDSERLEIGDLVLAIGNPFGIGQTVTSGIVSALARTRVGVSSYQFFIQTDAAINPGNSGGALVDMNGRLVGINTAIFSRSGGSNGIGFAIPSNIVDLVLSSLNSGGKVVRPWAGVGVQRVTRDLADSLGLGRPRGALITSLHPLSPLREAGLRRGDVVVRIGGKPIEQAREFGYRFANRRVGGDVGLAYIRGSQRRKTRVSLMPAPEIPERNETLIRERTPFGGLVVANVSPAVADELRLQTLAEGVVVTDVRRGPGARVGFKKGDLIVDVNGHPIERVSDLRKAINLNEGYWDIAVNRNGRVRRLRLGG